MINIVPYVKTILRRPTRLGRLGYGNCVNKQHDDGFGCGLCGAHFWDVPYDMAELAVEIV